MNRHFAQGGSGRVVRWISLPPGRRDGLASEMGERDGGLVVSFVPRTAALAASSRVFAAE
ncbi:MAG: hypothetical protein PGN25_08900 [Methylorubrum populi]